MRNLILLLGIAILLLGVAFTSASFAVNPEYQSSYFKDYVSQNYTVKQGSLYFTYIPDNLTLRNTTDLDFGLVGVHSSTPQNFSLVPVSNLSTVTISNYKSFSVGVFLSDQQNAWFNHVPPGKYALVEPGNYTDVFSVSPVNNESKLSSLLIYTGIPMGISGLVLTIVGITRKRRISSGV